MRKFILYFLMSILIISVFGAITNLKDEMGLAAVFPTNQEIDIDSISVNFQNDLEATGVDNPINPQYEWLKAKVEIINSDNNQIVKVFIRSDGLFIVYNSKTLPDLYGETYEWLSDNPFYYSKLHYYMREQYNKAIGSYPEDMSTMYFIHPLYENTHLLILSSINGKIVLSIPDDVSIQGIYVVTQDSVYSNCDVTVKNTDTDSSITLINDFYDNIIWYTSNDYSSTNSETVRYSNNFINDLETILNSSGFTNLQFTIGNSSSLKFKLFIFYTVNSQ